MGTENSSEQTAQRAKKLAEEIGAYHFDIKVDPVVAALVALFVKVTGTSQHMLFGAQAATCLQRVQEA